MNEFDHKLRLRLHEYKTINKVPFHKIADDCEISRNSLYAFSAGNSSMNSTNIKSLMDYLNLTVELTENGK